MPSSRKAPSKKPRTRTFSGCLTCRNRKVKCDLQKPACNNCIRLQLSCRGYKATIHWLPQWHPAGSDGLVAGAETSPPQTGTRMRTELLSDNMALDAIFACNGSPGEDPTSQLDRVLAELDSHAAAKQESDELPRPRTYMQGPFGVFSAWQSKTSSPAPQMLSSSPEDDGALTNWDNLDTFSSCIDDTGLFAATDISLATPADTSSIEQLLQSCNPSIFKPPSYYPTTDWQLQAASEPTIPTPISSQDLPANSSPYLPHCAQYLLWHYANHTIPSLSGVPVDRDRSVWNKIHLPTALRAYAELNVLGDSSLPRVSLLYSLLSIACFQLKALHKDAHGHGDAMSSSVSSGPSSFEPQSWTAADWEAQAIKFRNIAQKGLEKFLSNLDLSSSGSKQGFNYKEVLVAAVSLVCIRIVSGDTDDARSYILQCENIIRKMSRAKGRCSRKSSALHEIFFYIQVMEAASSAHRRSIQNGAALIADAPRINEDSPSAALIDYTTVSTTPQSQVVTRVSASELQLCDTDEEEDGMYGIPASLLHLLSCTTALIEEIETSPGSQQHPGFPKPPSIEIERKTSRLENDICTWPNRRRRSSSAGVDVPGLTAPRQLLTASTSGGVLLDDMNMAGHMQDCLTRAFHFAVLIHFFRSVRRTHPAILQHYVESVISDLETHASLKSGFAPTRLNVIVWPSFIAACEAVDESLRRRGIACLRQAAWAGFCNWEAAESVTREVWRRRDTGNANASWQQVVRDLPVTMVLT